MILFWCVDGSGDAEDKEDLIKVKYVKIGVYDRSSDEDVSRVAFMSI